MSGVNKAIIIGNLGRDPELTYTQTGTAVCKITVATSEKWNDKATGEKREKTEWHRITFFGKQGETISRYMKKGSQIYVEGKIQTEQYEKNGEKRYSTGITGVTFQFIGGNGTNTDAYKQKKGLLPPQTAFAQQSREQAAKGQAFIPPQQTEFDSFQQNNNNFQPPDDIPF